MVRKRTWCSLLIFLLTSCANHPGTPSYMKAKDLITKLQAKENILVLDSRSEKEFKNGHIKGAIHFPFWKSFWSTDRLKTNKHGAIVVYCAHGPRAAIVKAALLWSGFDNVMYLDGHMSLWKKENYPLDKGK